jgi:hypothetical protein
VDIMQLVKALDTTASSEGESAWKLLEPLGERAVPHLSSCYKSFRTWQGRASLVYHCLPYARTNDDAFRLGLVAATDRAKVVRYRAISLLAYAQRPEALPILRSLLAHPSKETAIDAAAAIDAIDSRNHHFFHDRDHSGMVTWNVHRRESAA